MCGFIGAVTYGDTKIENNLFVKALDKISYRGPDYTGTFLNDNISLGHKRLAIIDLDARSNQPFFSDDRSVALIFNGEIYNFIEIREMLIRKEIHFHTQSDTEVVIKAYQQWGVDCLQKLKGMFAICLVDFNRQEMLITRDRMGEKPLFYCQAENKLIVASEIKAILPLLTKKPSIDYTAILDYLTYGFVPNPKTAYNNIRKVKPGEYIIFSIRDPQQKRANFYYRIADKIEFNGNYQFNNLKEEFFSIINTVSPQISNCDVPYGAFLSGGVDSSIACWALKGVDKSVCTYTIGFENKNFDEREYASLVANHLNLENIQKEVSFDDLENVYSTLTKVFDEPFNDHSFVPTYYVSKEAKQFNTVVISGDGADELFGGYRKYPKIVKLEQWQSIFGVALKGAKLLFSILPDQSDIKRQLYRLGINGSELFSDLMALVFKKRELISMLGQELKSELAHYNPYHIIDEYLSEIPSDYSYLQKLRYLDLKLTLPDDMLVKVDRMSMVNSLEVRPLFLHPDIVEFALKLPDSLIATTNTSKVFLKKVMHDILPHKTLYRQKMGFDMPINEWIQKELNDQFLQTTSIIPKEYIKPDKIQSLYKLHKKNKRDFSNQLHSMMSLGAWME